MLAQSQRWEVVGGKSSGGITVRTGRDVKDAGSKELPLRLAAGAWVEEIERVNDRLQYRKVFGSGPSTGWVSTKLKTTALLEPRTWPPPAVKARGGAETDDLGGCWAESVEGGSASTIKQYGKYVTIRNHKEDWGAFMPLRGTLKGNVLRLTGQPLQGLMGSVEGDTIRWNTGIAWHRVAPEPLPEDTDSKPVILGYWDCRHLVAPLRMICEYGKLDYEDRRYELQAVPEEEQETKGSWDNITWATSKERISGRNALINLPYAIMDGRLVTQSSACLLALGRRCGLNGEDENERNSNEMVLWQGLDLRRNLQGVVYTPKADGVFQEAARSYLAWGIVDPLWKLDEYLLQRGTAFFSAERPLSADFLVWEVLDQFQMIALHVGAPPPWSAFPTLLAFWRRMRALPELKGYFAAAYDLPCQNKPSSFRIRASEVECFRELVDGAEEEEPQQAAAAAAAASGSQGPPPAEPEPGAARAVDLTGPWTKGPGWPEEGEIGWIRQYGEHITLAFGTGRFKGRLRGGKLRLRSVVDSGLMLRATVVDGGKAISVDVGGTELPLARATLPPIAEDRDPKPIVLGYWDRRALAAPSRMACAYAGADYEERRYELQPVPEEEQEAKGPWECPRWNTAKVRLSRRCALIHLPYLAVDGMLMAQSFAVCQVLGRKFGLCGEGEDQVSSNEMVLGESAELRDMWGGIAYTPADLFPGIAKSFLEGDLHGKLFKLEEYLLQRGTLFFSGSKPLTGDLALWDVVDQVRMACKHLQLWPMVSLYPELSAWHKRLRNDVPELASYFASDAYRLPCQNKHSSFPLCEE